MKGKKLYERVLDIESLTVSVLLYGFLQGFELGAFLFKILDKLIPNTIIRTIPSIVISALIAKALIDIANNLDEKLRIKVMISISILECLIMIVVLDVLKQKGWEDIVNLSLFSLFVPYVGFWLHHAFANKAQRTLKENKKRKEENIKSLEEQQENLIKQLRSLKENKTSIKESLKNIYKKGSKAIEHSCDECGRLFSSYNGKNRHTCPDDKEPAQALKETKEILNEIKIILEEN